MRTVFIFVLTSAIALQCLCNDAEAACDAHAAADDDSDRCQLLQRGIDVARHTGDEDNKEDDDKKSAKGGVAMPKMKDPFAESEHVDTIVSEKDMYNLSPCCCCLCACSHDRVGDATCFGCLPIRCGIMFIAIQIFVLAIVLFTVTFFQLLNEYFPWWFVFITLILLVPMCIAAM